MIKRSTGLPIYIFCYHKVLTMLMIKVFGMICSTFNWKMVWVGGLCSSVPKDADVVVFLHSLVTPEILNGSYIGAHFIRDPRDIIVSGYFYHKRCNEEWCTNREFDPTAPILFPKVPYSQQHRSEEWKRQYLESLQNASYQEILNSMTEEEGLQFEMENYGAWTIDSIAQWEYGNKSIKEIKFETLMSNFDSEFKALFHHLGFADQQIATALQLATREDINRKTDNQLLNDPHITSRETSRWEQHFKPIHREKFKHRFGDVLVQLDYEKTNNW
jgi:hypothetical protein